MEWMKDFTTAANVNMAGALSTSSVFLGEINASFEYSGYAEHALRYFVVDFAFMYQVLILWVNEYSDKTDHGDENKTVCTRICTISETFHH